MPVSGIPEILAQVKRANAEIEERKRLEQSVRAPLSPDTSANDNAAPTPRRAGKTVKPRPRKSAARDWRSLDRTKDFFAQERAARGTSFSNNPSCCVRPSQTANFDNDNSESANDNKPLTRRLAQDARDTRRPPDWKRTTDIGKAGAYQRAISEFGTPFAWTGNLSPDLIARGQASTEGFASWVLKRVARELRSELSRDPVVVIAIDVTASGRAHIHGGIALNDNEVPMAKRAIARACGRWQARNAERQVDIRPQTDADGWTTYSLRNQAAARRIVGDNVIAASAVLKAAGKSLHERLRG